MSKKRFFAPLLVSGLILGVVPVIGGTPEQGNIRQAEQGRAQQQGLGQQEQGQGNLGQQEQGQGIQQAEQGAQQALPKDMPKMIVIKAKPDKGGAETEAYIYIVDKIVKVGNEQQAQDLAKQLEQQQGVPIQEAQQGQVPAQVEDMFRQAEQGGGDALTWAPRWRYWNRGVYGYGTRNFYGYRYPNYFGNYGYYWNGVRYPYSYNNYYYPYGGYNYYYYYNPYFYR